MAFYDGIDVKFKKSKPGAFGVFKTAGIMAATENHTTITIPDYYIATFADVKRRNLI